MFRHPVDERGVCFFILTYIKPSAKISVCDILNPQKRHPINRVPNIFVIHNNTKYREQKRSNVWHYNTSLDVIFRYRLDVP